MAMHLANAISYITDEEKTQKGALGLQEQRKVQENSGNTLDNREAQGSGHMEVKNSRTEKADCQRQSRAAEMGAKAFLKKKEEMKVYTELGDEMLAMKGNDIFHNYFDTVNSNIRTAIEQKSDEREMEQGSRESSKENSRAGRTSPTESGKTEPKDTVEKTKAAKDTAEKIRNIRKEIKQPVKGR